MRQPLQVVLLALVAAPLAPACYQVHSGDGWQELYEVEPNDQPSQANWIGTLLPGDTLAVQGRIDELGPDLLDGFAMRSGAPIHVQFALWAAQPGADLDVCLYDPDLGEYIACWETSAQPETGAFTIYGAGKNVHLVVSSYLGDSAYRLEVRVYDTCCMDTLAPGDIVADGILAAHRAGTAARWARYGEQPALEPAQARRLVLPGEVLEIDLESGAILRQPALIELR